MKRIAVCSGGGVRGLEYPPLFNYLCRQSGLPIGQLFDLWMGTSTGGIAALLVAAGYSPQDIMAFYYKDAPRIFRKRPLAGYIGSKYRVSWLEAELKKYLDKPMGEAIVPVSILTFDKNSAELLFINSYDPYWKDFPMYKAATATAAAPAYFNSYEFCHRDITNKCVDAGGGANNPAREAIDEAWKLWPKDDIYMVNFDCSSVSYVNWSDGGLLGIARSVLEYAQIISMRSSAYGCKARLGNNYHLLAPTLRRPVPMDDADRENLDFIKAETDRFILQNQSKLDGIANALATFK